MNETEQIINLVSRHTKVLLANHWPDITNFLNGEESIKIAFSVHIDFKTGKPTIESGISFAKRIKDSMIETIDPDQMDLAFEAEKAKRGRPKKNILEAALTNGPMPEPEVLEEEH